MPIKLTDLIAKVPPQVEARVKRTRDGSRSVLQDALRAECRLLFRTPEETENNRKGAQVPVEVAPGHPAILRNISFAEDFEHILLLGRYRTILEQARRGTRGLLRLHEELRHLAEPDEWIRATRQEVHSTADWAAWLLRFLDQHDPLKIVLAVNEDCLGIYEYDVDLVGDERFVNRATIRLYWGVIGLVSEWMGCSVEDLSIVVLAHELAHAYTQLGADIEGRRWATLPFSKAESSLKEGLAQYYTDRVLRRLERRYAGALKVYETMVPLQSEAYQTHLVWVQNYSPEVVRLAMLEVRRWKEGKLTDFTGRLLEAKSQLHPTTFTGGKGLQ